MNLHFVQDIPTPHNNVLLRALADHREVQLHVWYARTTHPQYDFPADLAHEVVPPKVYGYRVPSIRLIAVALLSRTAKVLLVGWINPTTRLLVVLFWLSRRPYNLWVDHPRERTSGLSRFARRAVYFLIRASNARLFVVGGNALSYFRDIGFPSSRLTNLPIFIDVDSSPETYQSERDRIRAAYALGETDLFIVTGSRLERDKGFDLAVHAMSKLEARVRNKVRLLIIGRGSEGEALRQQVATSGLDGVVFFLDWLSSHDFMLHLAAADLVLHPARFDAFGGTTLNAMAAGVPVLGTHQAGSAADRIEHGVNGWLYDCNDTDQLRHWIEVALDEREFLNEMGVAARRTAQAYSAASGAELLVEKIR